MLQHAISVIAALSITLWATVLNQYHEFRDPNYVPLTRVEVSEVVPTISPSPTPLDTALGELINPSIATSTQNDPETPPVLPTTTPTVPFRPLPLPTVPQPTTPVVPETPTPTPFEQEPSPVIPPVDQNLSAEALLKGSIVNIICLPGGGLRGTSGTGVIIDPRGIILTVAHVGQQFLLTDYPEEDAGKCYIRAGSPAKNAYTASIVYISREWLRDNPTVFLESRPKGTGENDYALLTISGSLTGNSLPRSFTYIPLASPFTQVDVGDRVGIGSYGAEFLTSSEVRSSLYPSISFAPVNDVYTFDRSTEDVISVLAGPAAQEGSSGGAVINEDNELVGLISTRTVKPDLSMRELQAISVDHVRRSFREDMGESLDSYLSDNSLVSLVAKFQNSAISLLEDLVLEIERVR